MNGKLYATLASLVGARLRCETSGNTEWFGKHSERITELVSEHMPSGSGFDNGTQLDLESSDEHNKLMFTTSYHHMNDGGCYDGWTTHRVIVTPSLAMGYRLRITGTDRNGIKEYIAEMFGIALNEDTTASPLAKGATDMDAIAALARAVDGVRPATHGAESERGL